MKVRENCGFIKNNVPAKDFKGRDLHLHFFTMFLLRISDIFFTGGDAHTHTQKIIRNFIREHLVLLICVLNA